MCRNCFLRRQTIALCRFCDKVGEETLGHVTIRRKSGRSHECLSDEQSEKLESTVAAPRIARRVSLYGQGEGCVTRRLVILGLGCGLAPSLRALHLLKQRLWSCHPTASLYQCSPGHAHLGPWGLALGSGQDWLPAPPPQMHGV